MCAAATNLIVKKSLAALATEVNRFPIRPSGNRPKRPDASVNEAVEPKQDALVDPPTTRDPAWPFVGLI